jgi:hypothetical protein
MERGAYNARGPAADGSFGTQLPTQGERQEWRQERREERQELREERREDWQEPREERREDWQDYAEDHYDDLHDRYYGGYYGVYWTLPCTPTVMALGGTLYYVCGSDWYTRAYSDGDVVYTMVPSPTGH